MQMLTLNSIRAPIGVQHEPIASSVNTRIASLDGHALGEVPGLVDVAAADPGDVVGQNLIEAIAGATREGTSPIARTACDATIQAYTERANEAAQATEARSLPHQSQATVQPATTTAIKATAPRRSENAVLRRTEATSSRLRNGPREIPASRKGS